MIEVKVTVELPGIPDALNNLARAIADSHWAVTAGLLSAPVKQSTPAPVAPVTPVAPVAPAPAPVTPVAASPAPVASAAPVTEAPITQHALSVAGAKLVDMGKMDAVVNLLKQYGAVAITQLKEEQYHLLKKWKASTEFDFYQAHTTCLPARLLTLVGVGLCPPPMLAQQNLLTRRPKID